MEVNELIAALQAVEKQQTQGLATKAPANTHNGTLLTQLGGMFTIAGMDRALISTHIAPMGLGASLPVLSSNLDDPRFGLITGFGPTSGSEPVYPCDDAPIGYMKSGTLTAQFGRVMGQTATIEIDKILHQARTASTGLQLINEQLGAGSILPANDLNAVLNNVVRAEMVGVGVQLERKLAKMLWQGTPSANTAHGGYKEFPGLDAQIATGQKDAESNTLLPSVDSMIFNFNASVDSTTQDIVEHISAMEFHLRNKADRSGLSPVQWVIVMRPELFFELTAIWACRYMTDRCGDLSGNQVVTLNDDTAVRMRDEMRNGNFLLVNGRRIPVITDDGIYEANSTNATGLARGEFKSSIYFVPLRIRGNFAATYWEHVDYRNIGAQLSVLGEGASKAPFWSEGGRMLWVYRENGFCFDLQVKMEPRIILRTPQLAGKIQNVKYAPFLHMQSPFPESPYFLNGGVSTRSVGTSYAVWK